MTIMEVATASEARELTDRIKVAVEATWELIKEAWTIRAWESLGYASWDDYCTREFGTSRIRIPREERREAVASMREIGMSTRAIAAAVGVDHSTLVKDDQLAGGENSPPEADCDLRSDSDVIDAEIVEEEETGEEEEVPARVTGTDGKSYAARSSRASNRPPLPPRFVSAVSRLTKAVTNVEKLCADDRYCNHRSTIETQCAPSIRYSVEVLQEILSNLTK